MLTLLKFVEVILSLWIETLNISLTSCVEDLYQLGIKIDDMLLEGQVFTFAVVFLKF